MCRSLPVPGYESLNYNELLEAHYGQLWEIKIPGNPKIYLQELNQVPTVNTGEKSLQNSGRQREKRNHFESLFGGPSRGAQLLICSWLKNSPLLYRERSSLSTELPEGHPWRNQGGKGHSPSQPRSAESTLVINGVKDVAAGLPSHPKKNHFEISQSTLFFLKGPALKGTS